MMARWVKGVSACGDEYIWANDGMTQPVKNQDREFGLMWGWPLHGRDAVQVEEGFINTSAKNRSDLRQKCLTSFEEAGGTRKNMFFFEGNVLKHFEKSGRIRYYRFPLNSIHANQSDFLEFDDNVDKRVEQITSDLNLKVHDWKTKGDHIMIFLNRGVGGWSHMGIDVYTWLKETVLELRKYTDRPIKVKDHPGRHAMNETHKNEVLRFLQYSVKDVEYYHSVTKVLGDYSNAYLKTAWASVILTSTAGAVSMMKGVPTFVTHDAAYIKPWSAGELKDIENPNLNVDRDEFLRYYANSHWSLEEVEQGDLWRKLREQRGFGND